MDKTKLIYLQELLATLLSNNILKLNNAETPDIAEMYSCVVCNLSQSIGLLDECIHDRTDSAT